MSAPAIRLHFDLDTARRLARRFVAFNPAKPDQVELLERVAKRMVNDGVCVLHSVAAETNGPCWCNDCRPDVGRFA